jgi:glycine/D-amino acid oxidase-like deaminating enzyme
MHYTFPAEVQLAVKSVESFEHWHEIVGEPGEFRKTGFVRLVPRQELDLLKVNVAMLKAHGAKTEFIDCVELKKLEPDWDLSEEPAAAYEPESGYGDGALVAQDFMTAARGMDVEYQPKKRVTSLSVEDGRIRGVITPEGEIHASALVVAAGPWTTPLLQPIGVDVPIVPEFHQVAILRNALRSACRAAARMVVARFRSTVKS